jgi:long-chain fatty acid transport protein
MRDNSETLRIVLKAVIYGCPTMAAFATGFRLPDQDAFAAARGEAFVATADNPAAVYYNPAGITQLEGHNVRLGVYGISLNPSYHSPDGGTYHTSDNLHAVPQFFYAYVPEKFPLSFGLGLYSPYGLSAKWPQDTGFRSVALEGSLSYMTLNPVVAWKILPSLSVAAGPTFNYAETDLRQGLSPYPGSDYFRFKADGTDVGYNLGLRWQPLTQLAFGASYRSETTINYSGHTDMVPLYKGMSATADFPFPDNLILGVSYRPTPNWNFEFNADYTGWSRLKTVPIQQQVAVPPIMLNWDSSWYFEFGATRYLGGGWRVSAGYIFNENSVPDANYNPMVADLDRHFFSLGVGYQGKHFSFDVAYQLGYGPSRTVNGSAPSYAGQSADGKYDFLSNAIMLSAGWHF